MEQCFKVSPTVQVKVYAGWSDPWFCAQFVLINVLGFVLMYSAILCTAVCGPLTYNVAGTIIFDLQIDDRFQEFSKSNEKSPLLVLTLDSDINQ